jgi:hypothetical protein
MSLGATKKDCSLLKIIILGSRKLRRTNRKPIFILATFSTLVLLASAFPGLATSPLDPIGETPTAEESEAPVNYRALFEQELAAKRLSTSAPSISPASTREVDINLLLNSLPASARKSPSTRQQLIESLVKSGFKAKMPDQFRDLQKGKMVRNLDFPPKTRVINGAPIPISTTPYQVALVRSSESKNLYEGQFCGGSIIATSWILTAAHCVDTLAPSDLLAVSGIQTLPVGPAPRGTTASAVKSIIIHPLWQLDGFEMHDVALLELTRPLRFGPTVQAINLSDSSTTSGNAFVSGWGLMADGNYPSALQGGTTPIVACPEEYYTFDDGDGGTFTYLDGDTLVCAGSNNTADTSRVDACYGDSGGPLVRNNKLIGVVSFGPECPPAGIGAYANVNYFSDWIMCHAAIPSPFGGPYFCGDEALWITVGDTVKVSKAAWGGRTATIQWFADDVAIRGQTRNTLPLTGLFGKKISVTIKSAGFADQSYDFSSYTDGGNEYHETVQMGVDVKTYPSGDFVPCTAVNYQPMNYQVINKGSCSGTKGLTDGSLQSSAGWFPVSSNESTAAGFWAYRDVPLPANTFEWGWAILDPWSRGEWITGLPGEDEFIKSVYNYGDDYDYFADFGASYWGTYGTANPLVFDDHWSYFDITPFYPLGVEPPFEQTINDNDIIPSFYHGPLFEYRYDEDGYPILDEFGDPIPAWSQVTVKGKGRVVMGTSGSVHLGSRLTFELGLVVAHYK